MDLERESSAHESVEDNELATNPDYVSNLDHNKDQVKVNGSYSKENDDADTSRIVDSNTSANDEQVKEAIGNEVEKESLSAKSPSVGSPPLAKGYGLRKWRRIKRDVVKDGSANADNSKVLKRGLSNSGNPSKPTNFVSAEIIQNSEGSVGSTNVLRNMGVVDGLVGPGINLESRFAVGSAFAAGEDSENSEDRSSKSSTAASAPRLRYDLPTVLGYVKEKNRIKNLSGKNAGPSTQRVQQGKARVESSKKPRGERVKIEKENSHSSIESDSRSSNFVFMQGAYSVTSNGNQRERSMYYDGENSDDAHAGGQRFSEDQENAGEDEDAFQDDLVADASWEGKEEKSESHHPSTEKDPLVESILTLKSVQEALESEVQKLGEIGKVSSIAESSTFADRGIHESSPSEQLDSENIRQSNSLESQVLSLTHNVKYLESRLEEAEVMLKVKECKVAELENSLISGKSANNIELQQEKSREIETELEGIFKQKIEAEVEYLTLTKTIQKLRVAAGDQMTLFEQQENLAGEQVQMLDKIGEAERKAAMLMKQVEEVEKYRGDILGTEEVLRMQRRVCKVTSCFFMQLVLLILVFLLLVLHLSPQSGVVVPT
ncbi:WPP domain-interacting protein 1 [Ricinus communis]|uniref:WPP domain-interacting protein 1 n=1 Tax=Ricinus communis TaxID=3988 RepID=UPI0007727353|nr:WPP domain-interacting protein 1 [Ricinus communis]|eukprot:XP_015582448.1 WPP domain-interacting protein 1 [Ricinus communis]